MIDNSEAKKLFLQAKEGDKDSFDQIYELFAVPVYRYILLRTRHKQTSEDLTQTVFLKAYNSLSKFNYTGSAPLAWLFTIARNCIIDFFRKSSNIQTESEELLVYTPTNDDFVNELSQKQEFDAIKNCIKTLSEEQQEVIVLKFINDLTNTEISQILGKSEEAIRQLQSRGIKNLRKMTTGNEIKEI